MLSNRDRDATAPESPDERASAQDGVSRGPGAHAEHPLRQVLGDLQTPVAMLELSLGFLSSSLDGVDPDIRQALRDAVRAGRRIQQYIDHFVVGEISGAAGLRVWQRQVDLGSVLRLLIEEYSAEAAAAGTPLALELSGPTPTIRADATLVERALQSLVEGALGRACDGQRISVRARGGSVAEIQVCIDGTPLAGPVRDVSRGADARPAIRLEAGRELDPCAAALRRLSGVLHVEEHSSTHTCISIQLPAAMI